MRLREFSNEDIPLYSKWLEKSYVKKWYGDPNDWLIEVESPAFAFIRHFIVEEYDKPIGFCQYYDYSIPGETWHGTVDVEGTYSIDYLIGDEEFLGKGYGTKIIRALCEKVFAETEAQRIIVQPDEENAASCNTLRSAGFVLDEENKIYILHRTDLCP